uniref:BTB domain-containing protein n=1 Tax=Panagrolaimus sp. PS1159 TaxID=55785 RepID=A0AC35FQX3_9BILA
MECAVAMDWIVDEKNYLSFLYVPTSFIDGGYCIRIFVNEMKYDSKEKYVFFFLDLSEEHLIDANVTLSIASANFCDNFTFEYDSRVTNHISHESFFDPKNGYFQNGKLTVQLRGSLTYIIRKTHEIKSIKNVGEILWKIDGKDFTIELDDGEIKAHKFVL